MNRREELRGRFSALQAKRKSCLDMPDWQNNNLLEQENHLINILFSAITPLTKAETLLKNYESDLHSVNLQKKIKG